MSSEVKLAAPIHSCIPGPSVWTEGRVDAAWEPARTESAVWKSWDKWTSSKGRRRTAPGHDLQIDIMQNKKKQFVIFVATKKMLKTGQTILDETHNYNTNNSLEMIELFCWYTIQPQDGDFSPIAKALQAFYRFFHVGFCSRRIKLYLLLPVLAAASGRLRLIMFSPVTARLCRGLRADPPSTPPSLASVWRWKFAGIPLGKKDKKT